LFDVTIPKPLGVIPKNFPKRPGVGIASIKPDGNTSLHNDQVLLKDKNAMFILEGDEVVGINEEMCEGKDVEEVGAMVKAAEGDSITLKLCRNYQQGPVKVVWKPTLKIATMKRGSSLRVCEEFLGANVRFGCEDGWCSSCWHANELYMNTYRICKNVVPPTWDSVLPFILISAAELRRSKGVVIKNLVQADGVLPPREDGKIR